MCQGLFWALRSQQGTEIIFHVSLGEMNNQQINNLLFKS